MAEIRCGNCGGTHATVAEVRGCHADPDAARAQEDGDDGWAEVDQFAFEQDEGPGPPAGRPPARAAARPATATPPPAASPLRPAAASARSGAVERRAPRIVAPPAEAWPGPDALGRGLVVRPGAEVPPPWRDALRLRVDFGSPASDVVDQLDACRAGRRRY